MPPSITVEAFIHVKKQFPHSERSKDIRNAIFQPFFEHFPIFVFYTYFQLYHLTMSTECTYLMQSSLRYLRAVLCLIGAKSSYSALGATGTP